MVSYRFEAPPRPPTFDPRATLDKILKPLEAYQQRRDQALAALRAPPEEQETRFCWGGPGQFELKDVPPQPGYSVKIKDEDKDKDKKPEPKTLQWSEYGRRSQKIRVENPDDPEQYVIVNRIEWICFTPPGEEIKNWNKNDNKHKFTLRHPSKKNKNP